MVMVVRMGTLPMPGCVSMLMMMMVVVWVGVDLFTWSGRINCATNTGTLAGALSAMMLMVMMMVVMVFVAMWPRVSCSLVLVATIDGRFAIVFILVV